MYARRLPPVQLLRRRLDFIIPAWAPFGSEARFDGIPAGVPLHHAAAQNAHVVETGGLELGRGTGRHLVRAAHQDDRLVLEGRELGQSRLNLGKREVAGSGDVT